VARCGGRTRAFASAGPLGSVAGGLCGSGDVGWRIAVARPAPLIFDQRRRWRRRLLVVRLAPAVLVHDFGERDTSHRPEPADRIADRDDRVAVPVRG
jgi:hypothetical protein